MKTQKSFSAKIICSGKELMELWQLHLEYHRRLRSFITLLQSALEGRAGENENQADFYRRFVKFTVAADAKNAKYLFNGISLDRWIPNSANKIKAKFTEEDGSKTEILGETVTTEAVALLSQGAKLFDKNELMKGLPRWAGEFILNDAVAILSGYFSLSALWKSRKKNWERAKKDWKIENAAYMSVRQRIIDFEQENAKTTNVRSSRWDKYLEFFKANPDLLNWRGAEPGGTIVEYSDDDHSEIKKAGSRERSGLKIRLFFKNNPELGILQKTHRHYAQNFAPKRFKRGRIWIETDGFDRPPTFTLPDAVLHPRWLWLNGEQTTPTGYRIETLPSGNRAGKIKIQLLDTGGKTYWKTFTVRGDTRFEYLISELIEVKKKSRTKAADVDSLPENVDNPDTHDKKTKMVKKKSWFYTDKHLGEVFEADLKSTRLRFDINHRTGQPQSAYLDFSIKRESREPSEAARNVAFVPIKESNLSKFDLPEDATEENSKSNLPKRMKLPDHITVAFIHLGITSAAYGCIATGRMGTEPTILNTRKLWLSHFDENTGKWKGEPKLKKILADRQKQREKMRSRFRLTRGEKFDIELTRHIRKMEEDRYKKTARRIIDYARNTDNLRLSGTDLPLPAADIIIIGDFSDVKQKKENSRFLNELISIWKRPEILALAKDLGREAGIPIYSKSSWGGSRVCSKCGALGKRFLITKQSGEKNTNQKIVFSKIGRNFFCPDCGYQQNVEINAVINLAKSTFNDNWMRQVQDFAQKDRKEQANWHKETEEKLLSSFSLTKAI